MFVGNIGLISHVHAEDISTIPASRIRKSGWRSKAIANRSGEARVKIEQVSAIVTTDYIAAIPRKARWRTAR